MNAQLQTAVVGATGYAGFELARILGRHPRLSRPLLFSRESGNSADLTEYYPHVLGNGQLRVHPFDWQKLGESKVDLLFLATPHETSREWAPEALKRGMRVIDLSGAWRLKHEAHRAIYGFHDADPNLANSVAGKAVYGLPELRSKQISGSTLIANPGCYATSIIVALAPLVAAGVINRSAGIVCDSKSGVSGAGKQPTATTHFVEVADNLSAYGVFTHRHLGEILEQLNLQDEELTFTPHLLPIPRGILSTIYVRLEQAMTSAEVGSIFTKFYAGRPWVRIFGSKLPQIRYSLHTNYCDLGFNLSADGKRLVVVSCLDNLMKGAAGQAVQNMNVMFGFDEKDGLN
ncbi:MAG: N-acetyl-gamma-glutamyl-phosphate reductase [Acidobacteria bacterium]|nr:MAG: N-acetyl-gamma-glutamyl-phosphate reductase [Acidobacteriota bacterium]PYY22326.1 MAG: N-acetyl-gamma-glutamyl-phosphate reductase [Acidobacteriota bacterium]